MTLRQLLELMAFPLLIAVGQLLFKQTAQSVGAPQGLGWLLLLARSSSFWLAIVLYAGSTLLWLKILAGMPLSRAYPVVALSFVVVPLMGWMVFHEAITTRVWLGMALIVGGVGLIGTAR